MCVFPKWNFGKVRYFNANLLIYQSFLSLKPMLVLGIETSCDETGLALFDNEKGLLGHVLHSQVDLHEAYGGVVPELASRDHIRLILPLLESLFKKTGVKKEDVDAIAYTQGPGLSGALLVGSSLAEALAFALQIPTVPIHHLEGHLLAPLLEKDPPTFPFLALLVSGGHTQIIHVKKIGQYEIIGDTLDDAAGEAFDKIAKLLNLPYPGGPVLDKLAQGGDVHKFKFSDPRNGLFDFTFSGLKTSVLYFLQKEIAKNPNFISENLNDICASVQFTIVDALIKQLLKAAKNTKIKNLAIAGGVSANSELRKQMNDLKSLGFNTYIPSFQFCTDNAAMIGIVGYFKFLENDFCDLDILPQAKF